MDFVTFQDTEYEREREKEDWKRKENVTTPGGYELIYIYIYISKKEERKKVFRGYWEEREEDKSQWPEVRSTRLPNIVAENGLLVLSTVDLLHGESSNLGRSGMPGARLKGVTIRDVELFRGGLGGRCVLRGGVGREEFVRT